MRTIALAAKTPQEWGKTGENNATALTLNVAADLALWPAGTPQATFYRPDGVVYPITCTISGATVSVPLTSTETTTAGRAQVEIQWIDTGVVAKSATFSGNIMQSLSEPGDVPADPGQAWLDAVTAVGVAAGEAKADAETARDEAQGYAASMDTAIAEAIAPVTSQLADNVEKINLQNDRFLQVADPYTLENVAFTTETAKYIKADGSIGSVASGDIHLTVSSDIDVTGGDIFMISVGAGWGGLYYAILDENGVLLTGATSPNDKYDNLFGIVISIPCGAATLRVSGAYSSMVVKKVTKSSAKLAKVGYIPSVTHPSSVSIVSLTDVPNYLLNMYGIIKPYASANYIVATIDVAYGDVCCISARANYENALYAFYYSDGTVALKENAASGAAYTTITKKIVVVPFGATTLTISYSPRYGEIAKVTSFRSHPIWEGLKWACIGDSLTEVNMRALRCYHDYIAYKTGISVYNMGVSGSGYKKLEGENKAFYQRILNVPTDVDVVTIFGSGNDLSLSLGNVTDTGTTTLCGCINTTIDNLFSVLPTVPLGIVTPTPWGALTPGNSMELYSDAILAICKRRGIKCIDLYHESGLRPWDATYKSLMFSRDEGSGTHPDENGHALIAPKFDALLRSLLLS